MSPAPTTGIRRFSDGAIARLPNRRVMCYTQSKRDSVYLNFRTTVDVGMTSLEAAEIMKLAGNAPFVFKVLRDKKSSLTIRLSPEAARALLYTLQHTLSVSTLVPSDAEPT